MADARNRLEKELRDLRIQYREFLRKQNEPPPFEPECAGCGLRGMYNYRQDDSPIRMYCYSTGVWRDPDKFYCEDCLEVCTGIKPFESVGGKFRDL